ncbi:hypothetical protein FHX81_2306 [Saccharothrix saharensis]|uniref:Uncharacterized protein n=1 Tax=Saccharothrix saharensis TaxID=571190 RepID=A0A543JAZ5_9PSEU|nr:hypothetical protein [Saccharothrix saharensis]TQM79989.1 hypothetical protein FHX81_2306 [Saccharothrix saharensis]
MGVTVASGDEPRPEQIKQIGGAANGSNVNQAGGDVHVTEAGRDVKMYDVDLHVPIWVWAAVSVSVVVAAAAVTWATWHRPTAEPSVLDTEHLSTTITAMTTATTTATTATTTTSPAPPEASTAATRLPTATTTPTPAPATVWWTGNLKLGGYGGTGGGWWLDRSPPGPAVTGDLYYGSETEVAGVAMVKWDGAIPPDLSQCTDLLDANLGQAWTAVRRGTTACLRTRDGRVRYFTVIRTPGPNELNPSISVTATVWDKG